MKGKLRTGVWIVVFGFSGLANANTVIDLIGDKDGFGIGVTSGSGFDWTSLESGDGDGTDEWITHDYAFTHSWDISELGAVTSAELEIFTGGQGWFGLTTLYLDDVLVGTLTDGDDVGSAYNYAWLETFDLMPFLGLINGVETIRVDCFYGGDGWGLDYSQLTISDENTAPIPEPATILLFGTGLAGLAAARRRKKA